MSSLKLTRFALVLALCPTLLSAFASYRHHHKATPKKHAVAASKKVAAKVVIDPALKPLVGTWYVTRDLKEDRSMRFAIRPNGTFVFAGTMYKSEGTLAVKDGNLEMQWTMVDDTPVAPGSMHRTVALSADLASFVVDQYTYTKSDR